MTNAIDIDRAYTLEDTKFAAAFGIVDSKLRSQDGPTLEELQRHFEFQVYAVQRISNSTDREDIFEPQIVPFSVHQCTEEDRDRFYDFVDLDTVGVERVWS